MRIETMVMRRIMQVVSWLALVGTILPSVMFLAGRLELPLTRWLMLPPTIVWFVVTPFWMGRVGAVGAAGN